jgi:hypothetical protein
MKTIYYANDGKKFYEREDCICYERKLLLSKSNLKVFNENKEIMDLCRDDFLYYFEEYACYIYLKDKKDLDLLCSLLNEYYSYSDFLSDDEIKCIDNLKDCILLCDTDGDSWITVDRKFKRLSQKYKEYDDIRKELINK